MKNLFLARLKHAITLSLMKTTTNLTLYFVVISICAKTKKGKTKNDKFI